MRFKVFLEQDQQTPAANQEKTNAYFPDFFGREFSVKQRDFEAALEGDALTLYGDKIPDFGWPFRVAGNIHVFIEKIDDNLYKVTFPLKQLYRDNPYLFYHRWQEGQRPMYWQGPVEDKVETMTKEQLLDAWVEPFAAQLNQMPPSSPAGI